VLGSGYWQQHLSPNRKILEKSDNPIFADLTRIMTPTEQNKAADPGLIRLLSSNRVLSSADLSD
jgi:hypothetical protein